MKLFTQLALVSAMAVSANAMALQALDDDTLSATTGQDGITVKITPPSGGITIDKLVVHDGDGVGSLTGIGITDSGAGAIILGNVAGSANDVKVAGGDITLAIDADDNGGAPVLNVNVGLPSALTISTGDIGVATSGGVGVATSNEIKILDTFDLVLGGATLNIQLGNQPQGAMIKLGGTMTGGLTINNLKLNDTNGTGGGSTPGSLFVKQIKVDDAGASTDLALNASVDIDSTGLVVTNNATTGLDVALKGVVLGAAPTVGGNATDGYTYTGGTAQIGDVELLGLNTGGMKITVSGH